MSRVVLKPKYLGERKDYLIDFTSLLEQGQVIESAVCTIAVYCGVDPAPAQMLSGPAVVSQDVRVRQRIEGGAPGVIYHLKTQAVTDFMEILTLHAYLAVLDPDTNVADPECCTRIGNAASDDGQNFVMTNTGNPVQDYRDGLPLYVIFDDIATIAEPTIDVDGLGPKDIVLTENTAIQAYEIMDDDVLHLVFDEDADSFILMNKIATQWIAFKQDVGTVELAVEELFDMPGLPAATILAARAGVRTASSANKPTFMCEADGSDIFTTALTIDVGEKGSWTASVPVVIDPTQREQQAGWELAGFCTAAGTDAAGWWLGLKVRFRE